MPNEPIFASATNLDLSSRVLASTAVVASPADATEVIIASLTLPANIAIATGVLFVAQVGFTVGTNGVSGKLRIRQTTVAGSAVTTGPTVTLIAANIANLTLCGVDTAPAAGQVYKLTLAVGSASAASAISELGFFALAV